MAPAHRDASLEKADRRVQQEIKTVFLTKSVLPARGFVLVGPLGCGKSSDLAIILRIYLERLLENTMETLKADADTWRLEGLRDYAGQIQRTGFLLPKIDAFFMTHAELIRQLRDGGEIPLRKLALIDDFGRGYDDKAGWNLSLQEEYFDWRWRFRLPTFITTNLTPVQLRSWAGWERIIDRIGDPGWMAALAVNRESGRK